MKLTKIFTLILVCCLLFSAASTTAMAMELNTDMTQEKTSQTILRSIDNEFLYESSNSSKKFTITKNTSYFIYNSGPFGTTNPVFIKFTNTNTGASCTHPIYGSTINRKINCNLTDGTYTAEFLNDENAVGYLHIVFYN